MEFCITLKFDVDLLAHDEGLENCIKWAVIDGMLDHFCIEPGSDYENQPFKVDVEEVINVS